MAPFQREGTISEQEPGSLQAVVAEKSNAPEESHLDWTKETVNTLQSVWEFDGLSCVSTCNTTRVSTEVTDFEVSRVRASRSESPCFDSVCSSPDSAEEEFNVSDLGQFGRYARNDSSCTSFANRKHSGRSGYVLDRVDEKGVDKKQNKASHKILFDTFKIRTWFMSADKDNNGYLRKSEFLSFLTENPELSKMLTQDLRESRVSETEGHPQGKVQRHLLKCFKEIDADKKGTLDFEEFLALFKRAGCFLEYTSEDNPRERAADVLASLSGTGKVADIKGTVQSARRGSESRWALDQQAMLNMKKSLPARRHSATVLGTTPASFWGDTLVLGPRRRSWQA